MRRPAARPALRPGGTSRNSPSGSWKFSAVQWPQEWIDFSAATAGPVLPLEAGKTRITIRLDTAVIAWFRDQVAVTGGSYQTLINDALKAHIDQHQRDDDLEQTLRRVLREELDARRAA